MMIGCDIVQIRNLLYSLCRPYLSVSLRICCISPYSFVSKQHRLWNYKIFCFVFIIPMNKEILCYHPGVEDDPASAQTPLWCHSFVCQSDHVKGQQAINLSLIKWEVTPKRQLETLNARASTTSVVGYPQVLRSWIIIYCGLLQLRLYPAGVWPRRHMCRLLTLLGWEASSLESVGNPYCLKVYSKL